MTHSLYTKFVLGYLLFGLLGFVLIATFSSHMTQMCIRDRMYTIFRIWFWLSRIRSMGMWSTT